ncbi:DNA-lyase 2 [Sphaerosporella brunnea]|uniref:DNA-(apurinic or apyrimidinic site) endonuclease 2 n=1 Tax=Sphaerosporella brunnea TaxID=1250544 RepID=A0A5J5EQT2_9PEZI|nr:DNA-lyase 2 [Sphaerosporella brunnea]
MALRITTWNGALKNPFSFQPWSTQKTFEYMFDTLEADIVCFQETKIQKKDLTDDMVLVPGWDSYFTFPKLKKGYSGVAVYTRNSKCQPIRAEEGITGYLEPPSHPGKTYKSLPSSDCIGGYPELSKEDALLLDSEGRALVLDFGAFVLIGTYCPASVDPTRDAFRIAFVEALFCRVRKLVTECKRRVVVVGDLNIARDEIDAAGAKEMMREFQMVSWKETPTRDALDRLLAPNKHGVMVDLCREYFPSRLGMYTCWDVKKNKRPGNAGSRIDYILCSSDMQSWFSEANIQEGLMGSDHCPVFATLTPTVNIDGKQKNILDLVNPEGMFRSGERQTTFNVPAKPRLCMRRFPEFSQRQNIKEMFRKISSTRVAATMAPARASTPPSSVGRPAKRLKSSSSSSILRKSQIPKSQGQKTLTGFLKPAVSNRASPSSASDAPQTDIGQPRASSLDSCEQPSSKEAAISVNQSMIDPIESKEQWDLIFSKRRPPVCEAHGEECIQLVTKKPGLNHGRAFWMCRRPIGPEGESVAESGRKTEWRCNFFKWASDLQ